MAARNTWPAPSAWPTATPWTRWSGSSPRVWLDPGFGFAKDTEQNFALLDRLDELTELFREPLYIGLSRKRMIYNTLGTTADEAFNGTVALDALALDRGAAALRVHDVRPAVETVSLLYRNT